jgi:hypothetical protein
MSIERQPRKSGRRITPHDERKDKTDLTERAAVVKFLRSLDPWSPVGGIINRIEKGEHRG